MLNAVEVTIARELASRKHTTKDQLFKRLYARRKPDDRPAPKILDLLIHKLRRKLPKDTIKTLWGNGYEVTSDKAKVLRNYVAQSDHA